MSPSKSCFWQKAARGSRGSRGSRKLQCFVAEIRIPIGRIKRLYSSSKQEPHSCSIHWGTVCVQHVLWTGTAILTLHLGQTLGQEREEAAEKAPQWLGKRRIDTVHLAHSQNKDCRTSPDIFGLQQPGPLDYSK